MTCQPPWYGQFRNVNFIFLGVLFLFIRKWNSWYQIRYGWWVCGRDINEMDKKLAQQILDLGVLRCISVGRSSEWCFLVSDWLHGNFSVLIHLLSGRSESAPFCIGKVKIAIPSINFNILAINLQDRNRNSKKNRVSARNSSTQELTSARGD